MSDVEMNIIPCLQGNFVNAIDELLCHKEVKVVIACNEEVIAFKGTLVKVNCDSIVLEDAEVVPCNSKLEDMANAVKPKVQHFKKVVIPVSKVCFIGIEREHKK